jgi:hypothetical protein
MQQQLIWATTMTNLKLRYQVAELSPKSFWNLDLIRRRIFLVDFILTQSVVIERLYRLLPIYVTREDIV